MSSSIVDIRLYTVEEAAQILRVTERWLAGRLRARELPGHKVGRNWRMTHEDIEAAVESMAMPAVAAVPDPHGLTRTSRRRANRRARGAA